MFSKLFVRDHCARPKGLRELIYRKHSARLAQPRRPEQSCLFVSFGE